MSTTFLPSSFFLLSLFFLVFFYSNGIDAYTEESRNKIKAALDPAGRFCANKTGVTPIQVQAAKKERNVNDLSPCFFRCFLEKFLLIKVAFGKEVLDELAILAFAQTYIPTVILKLIPIGVELTECAAVFANEPQSDDEPGCYKTSALVNCLADKPFLIAAIIEASRSNTTTVLI